VDHQRIKREYLTTTLNFQSVPVLRVWYGDLDITVAFAAFQKLPVFPVKQGYKTIWAVFAIDKQMLRIWTNEYVTICELHHIDMGYPRINERIEL
jgi:hypothetical protein